MKKAIIFLCAVVFFAACSDDENAATDLKVTLETRNVTDAESRFKVFITSNTSWKVSSTESWCTPLTLEKFGNDSLEIKVLQNDTYDERIAYVSVQAGDNTIITTVKVIQNPIGGNALRRNDSLVLVNFYEAYDGENWTDNTGWKTGNLDNWHGITVTDNRITAIKFENNNLTGEFFSDFTGLDMFDTLSIISEPGITGTIPTNITQLKNLKYLNITETSVSGEIIAELGDMENLEELIISLNANITGNIPATLGNITTLKKLILHNLPLTDESKIPIELGNLINLNYLSITSCNLDGTIPTEVFNLSDLIYLSFSDNSLYGKIETDFENLTKLEILDLSGNDFSGKIPTTLESLTALKVLKLGNNHLEGKVPEGLTNSDVTLLICPQSKTFTNYICD